MGYNGRPCIDPSVFVLGDGGNRRLVPVLFALAGLLWGTCAVAQSGPTDGVWGIGGVRIKPDEKTNLTVGVFYLGGLRATAPFVLGDRSVDSHWELNGGYFWTTQAIDGEKDPVDHTVRAGITYKHEFGPLLLENRLLYEAILNERRRANGNRLRNRTRVTYNLATEKAWEPRVFAHIEPVLDDRDGRPARLDMALGFGGTLTSRWRLDIFGLRQAYPKSSRSGFSALVVQVIVQLNGTKPS